jgi:hypothetical protein
MSFTYCLKKLFEYFFIVFIQATDAFEASRESVEEKLRCGDRTYKQNKNILKTFEKNIKP